MRGHHQEDHHVLPRVNACALMWRRRREGSARPSTDWLEKAHHGSSRMSYSGISRIHLAIAGILATEQLLECADIVEKTIVSFPE